MFIIAIQFRYSTCYNNKWATHKECVLFQLVTHTPPSFSVQLILSINLDKKNYSLSKHKNTYFNLTKADACFVR